MVQCAKEFLRLCERTYICRQKEKARGRHEQKENTVNTIIYLAISISINVWMKHRQNKIVVVKLTDKRL